jgi:acetyl/propionyl-CoA carboxylase alpha subunit
MFKKILIANRGEIAVRIVRTCREMGILTVALYDDTDRTSLHVRLADECVPLPAGGYMNSEGILSLAAERGVDAIHPGYGYLAEDSDFIAACTAAGFVFIGPPAETVALLGDKIGTLTLARAAGLKTPKHSPQSFGEDELEALGAAAAEIGYPVVIKSCSGGRGRGERLVTHPDRLPEAVRAARAEARAVYGNTRLYVEGAILPAHQVGVQILGDQFGDIVHLGDREGSIILSNHKLLEESPALCLSDEQRESVLSAAIDFARRVGYRNAGTVEFLIDEAGEFYFSEVKPRIQVEHTLSEARTRLDLIREQIRLAAGEALNMKQADIWLGGHAIMVRVRAEDTTRGDYGQQRFMPSPGTVRHVRLPGGPEVRVDTYVYGGAEIPGTYAPLIAKVTVWAADRERCVQRLRRALEDFAVVGVTTNLPLLLRVTQAPEFVSGRYTTDFLRRPLVAEPAAEGDQQRADLAVAAAVAYLRRREAFNPQDPERWSTNWHRSSRVLPG